MGGETPPAARTTPRVTVLVAAGVRLYGDGIRLLLECEGDLSVVGQAASGALLLALVDVLPPFDVALVDIAMGDGLEAIQALHRRHGDVRVVALGVSEQDAEVVRCAEAGVAGYVARESGAPELVATVRSVARGEVVCSPRMTATVVARLAWLADERVQRGGDDLTSRQREVLYLIGEGLSNKEIAARLCIELPTVKSHVHMILAKLGARRRGEAAAWTRAPYGDALHPRI